MSASCATTPRQGSRAAPSRLRPRCSSEQPELSGLAASVPCSSAEHALPSISGRISVGPDNSGSAHLRAHVRDAPRGVPTQKPEPCRPLKGGGNDCPCRNADWAPVQDSKRRPSWSTPAAAAAQWRNARDDDPQASNLLVSQRNRVMRG
jgi:hypothetical protein